ncbi:NIPSNAP family protein [Mariluticola halotolerans]|uniref:NIPSNAP family protein n=1 Tax=Mariluticola halotolerans TaxID=2909283 RepID=UPI0026E2535E|nr:NIPSNAP family protein [Mariluticola halotolerans]UJQ94106.1 NIPSNAP family protein [Mariluticola halotolerans]
MTYYEIATLKTVIFGAGKAAAGLEKWLTGPEAQGTLLGAFGTDIGGLNEVYVLRSYAALDDLAADKTRALMSSDPFGCSEHLVDITTETYKPFNFLPEVATGKFGPIYEFRTYKAKLNGLNKLQEIWRDAIPPRLKYSPMVTAMYGLDGAPRLTQIWPYESLEARAKARSQSVADGNWPPKGGPDWLQPQMTSAIAMPLPFSPLS